MIIRYIKEAPNYLNAFGCCIYRDKNSRIVLKGESTLYLARFILLKQMAETMYIHGACYLHNAGINEEHN